MVHIVSVNNFFNRNGSSVITYKPTVEAHYGTLLCSSRNELGPQVVPCVFHIVSAGKYVLSSLVNMSRYRQFDRSVVTFSNTTARCEKARYLNKISIILRKDYDNILSQSLTTREQRINVAALITFFSLINCVTLSFRRGTFS